MLYHISLNRTGYGNPIKMKKLAGIIIYCIKTNLIAFFIEIQKYAQKN